MKTELLRSDSKGLTGTLENAEHHAIKCKKLIDALVPLTSTFKFKTWKQGHNVHIFVTEDDRRYDIVPYLGDDGDGNIDYIGLELRVRQSRSVAIPLLHITNLHQVPAFVGTLKLLARSSTPNSRVTLKSKVD